MPTGNVHPSFLPLWYRTKERGMYSPNAYVEYWVGDHGHGQLLGDSETGQNEFVLAMMEGKNPEDVFEEVTDELIANIIDCATPGKRKGHGRKHDIPPREQIYKSVVKQLTETDFDREHAELEWNIAMYRKWGDKHMPAAVIIPSEADPNRWEVLVPDENGDPRFYGVRKRALSGIPTAAQAGAKKLPFGYRAPYRWPVERRMRQERVHSGKHR